jgi:hypothetical protein
LILRPKPLTAIKQWRPIDGMVNGTQTARTVLFSSHRSLASGAEAMANREQRGNKEKKKPKSDKNKKSKHQPFGGQTSPGQSQDHPGFNLLAKKG